MFYDSEERLLPERSRIRYYNNQYENSLGLRKLDKKNLSLKLKYLCRRKFKIEKNLKNNKLDVLKKCF